MTNEPLQRSNTETRYRFDDRDMDFAFQMALGATPTGGLAVGELYHVASQIVDGDTSSWVREFERFGDVQTGLAAQWRTEGRFTSASEVLMKAFYCYRQAWQFAAKGRPASDLLVDKFEKAFAEALELSTLPTQLLEIPYESGTLPGLRLDAGNGAPTLIVLGGLDSSKEDMYHLMGLNAWRRGYTTVIVDLPGQGTTPARGLHLMAETERPIGAVIDYIDSTWGVDSSRLALLGMSAGGYMVSRAVMSERRVAACVASTPISNGAGILPTAALVAMSESTGAMRDHYEMYAWRAGVSTPDELGDRFATFLADPAEVTCSYLTVAGDGESPAFLEQARDWHDGLSVEEKKLVVLDVASGADAHCQINNLTRLTQEVCDWLDQVLPE